jgi:cold shock CspA family protein
MRRAELRPHHFLPHRHRGGFLESDDGREIYFHRNSVLDGAFPRLEIGAQVSFAEEAGDKGPQASTVRPPGKKHGLRMQAPQGRFRQACSAGGAALPRGFAIDGARLRHAHKARRQSAANDAG